ncbi:OmpA/MotB family protein [Paenibacillus cymbidii]|uniref:OmpA/MotB family protein n=1 Tax=Paenibacillus cymbidii TaxID=1639034 RepID=UPI0010811D9E|nr:flagellar motor protein MotB [Paenibacillus cymbidii]
MARRGKRKAAAEDHGGNERWLITYADLITLLLVFFVIMYAMSKIDIAKFDVIAQSLSFQFKKSDTLLPHGNGFLKQSGPGAGSGGDASKKNDSTEEEQFPAAKTKEEIIKDAQRQEQVLQELKEKLSNYVEANNLQTQIHVTDTPRGIAVTLEDLFLFDLGKADLKQPSFPLLDKLATFLPTLNSKVSIEGHTDNLPLTTGALYKDNWDLSYYRSKSVLDYFVKQKLPDNMFVIQAKADTEPVAPNDTPEHRQQNRRVEIVVLRDQVDPNAAAATDTAVKAE